ncbi:MAG: PQQ-binding-like beta-propeller repeat protein [Candidatus Brocadiia bacterium]
MYYIFTPAISAEPAVNAPLVEVIYTWNQPKNPFDDIIYRRLSRTLDKEEAVYYYAMYARCKDEILITGEDDVPLQEWLPDRVIVNGKALQSNDYTGYIGKSRIILYQQSPYGLLELGEMDKNGVYAESIEFVNTTASQIGQESPPSLWYIGGSILGAASILDYVKNDKEPTNHAPTALFNVIPETGSTNTVFWFDAGTSSDIDEPVQNLMVRWDWENDGVWDTSFSIAKTITRTFTAGAHTIAMQMRDSAGAFVTATKTITVIAPGGPLAATPQPIFHTNLQRTGLTAMAGPVTDTVKRQYATGGVIQSSPVIAADNTIYAGSFDGKVYALNPNGTLKWASQILGQIYSTPAIGSDGTLYIGAGTALYALNNTTGAVNWSYNTGNTVRSSPAIGADGTIYFGSGNGNIYAVNYDGSFKWLYPTGGAVDSAPAIAADGTLYIGSNDNYLYALDTNPLSLRWRYQAGGAIVGVPAVGADGTVYAGATNGIIYAINPNGTLKWTAATAGPVYSSPAVNATTLHVGSDDFSLYSIALATGGINWSFPTTATIRSSPAIDTTGNIYFGSDDGRVYCLNSAGTVVWSRDIGSAVRSSPAINNSNVGASPAVVYIGADNGSLYTIGSGPADPANIVLSKKANKQYITIGEIITYNITVSNFTSTTDTSNNNIVIDTIPAGFRYIPGSSVIDGVNLADPVITGTALTFPDLDAIAPGQTKTLSYQLIAGSGLAKGRYVNSAYCDYFDVIWKTSNTASEEVMVIDDPLFDLGTIMGRVFIDTNANGVFDQGEKGVASATIIMENGVLAITDKEGMYHIPAVKPGTHHLKIGSYAEDYSVGLSQIVRVTEGLLLKVNFAINPKYSDNIYKNGYGGVMLGSGEIGYSSVKGNTDLANRDKRLQKRLYTDGRLAFYTNFVMHPEAHVIVSYDTDRISNKNTDLFKYTDPDKYYPTYGDNSRVSYEGANTQGPLYLLAEMGDGNTHKLGIIVGNYQTNINKTELINYNRALYGANVYLDVPVPKGFDRFVLFPNNISLFTSQSRQVPAVNEFQSTGGSFYYLKNQSIVTGSEKVTIETRDKLSNLTLSSVTKARDIDYEIDYGNGRIIFFQPVGMVQESSTIISSNILNGNPVYIKVAYEYETDALDYSKGVYGGRIATPNIGLTYIQSRNNRDGVYPAFSGTAASQTDTNDYTIGGADVNLSFPISGTGSIDIKAEYAQSESTGIPDYFSLDGGSGFSPISTTKTDGNAYLLKTRADITKDIQTSLVYQRTGEGFESTATSANQGTQKYGMNTTIKTSDRLKFMVGYDAQETLEPNPATIAGTLIGAQKNQTAFLQANWALEPGKLNLTGEYRYQDVEIPSTALSDNNSGTDILAARLDYQYTKQTRLFVAQQFAIQDTPTNQYSNTQTTLGGSTIFSDKSQLSVQGSVATDAYSVLSGFSYPVSSRTNMYTNYGLGASDTEGQTMTSAIGGRSQVTNKTSVYAQEEYKTSDKEQMVSNNQKVGEETQLTSEWTVRNSFETGLVNYFDETQTTRQVVSVNAQYSHKPARTTVQSGGDTKDTKNTEDLKSGLTTLSTKLEFRADNGIQNKKQYLTANNLKYQLTEDLSGMLRLNWARTDNTTTDKVESLFREYGIGTALRPVKWDKWLLIAKYTYLEDIRNQSNSQIKANIYALETAYDILPPLQVVEKYAHRRMSEEIGYIPETHSNTDLWINRINYTFGATAPWRSANTNHLKSFIVGGEYRILRTEAKNSLTDQLTGGTTDKKTGYLAEIGYKFDKTMHFGIGYNFTDFTDNLEHTYDYSVRGFFIRMNIAY